MTDQVRLLRSSSESQLKPVAGFRSPALDSILLCHRFSRQITVGDTRYLRRRAPVKQIPQCQGIPCLRDRCSSASAVILANTIKPSTIAETMKTKTNSILMPFWHLTKSKMRILAPVVLAGVIPATGFAQDSITLLNPSFEWGYNAANVPNHAHGGVYFGWTPSTNAIGIDDTTGPYWDNGGAVDGTYVGYIQGLGGYFGALSQTNSGFQVGATYWIQFFANARQTNGITPLASATNPVVAVIETASTAGTSALVSGLKIPYSDVLGTAGTGNPFTFINVTFTAGAANGVLTIEKRSPTPSGKSALLLDGFSIIRRTTNDIVVANPSFEASGMGQTPPGYMPVVAGWTKAGGGNLAISQQGGAFADNGAVPDGGNVLALQCSLTDPVGVSQALHGLIPGATYWLTLYLNGRAVDPAGGYTNLASVTIDGQTAYRGPVAPSGPANSLDPFLFVSFSFVASAADVTVSIENQAQDSSTLLVDNLRVFTPFSVSISPHGGGLQIDWPVGHLESATNVSGPWRSEPGAVSPWAVTPSASMKFYRSVLP